MLRREQLETSASRTRTISLCSLKTGRNIFLSNRIHSNQSCLLPPCLQPHSAALFLQKREGTGESLLLAKDLGCPVNEKGAEAQDGASGSRRQEHTAETPLRWPCGCIGEKPGMGHVPERVPDPPQV